MNLGLAKALDRAAGSPIARVVGAYDAFCEALSSSPPPIDAVRGVLVTRLWGIGNWALLRPIVRDLRARFPSARFHALTLSGNAPLVADLVDDLHLVRATGLAAAATDLARAQFRLAADPPTISLDFEPFATAGALVARFAGIPQRLGFSGGPRARDALLTVHVPFRRDAHASRSFRDLAEAAGVPAGPYVPGALEPTPAGRAEAERVLSKGGVPASAPLVVLHPGSGDNFPGRRWSPVGFAAAGRHAIERHGAAVAVTGSASEAALVEQVAHGAGPGAAALAGALSLEGLVALLSRASVLVANDTGPVHLASALGRPVLAMFGPNSPALYGPLSAGSRSFYRALPCSPCLTVESHRSSRCRIPTCIASLSTGEVLLALSRVLESEASSPSRAEAPHEASVGARAGTPPGLATRQERA